MLYTQADVPKLEYCIEQAKNENIHNGIDLNFWTKLKINADDNDALGDRDHEVVLIKNVIESLELYIQQCKEEVKRLKLSLLVRNVYDNKTKTTTTTTTTNKRVLEENNKQSDSKRQRKGNGNTKKDKQEKPLYERNLLLGNKYYKSDSNDDENDDDNDNDSSSSHYISEDDSSSSSHDINDWPGYEAGIPFFGSIPKRRRRTN